MKNLNEIEQEAKENCEVLIVKKADVEKVRTQIKCDLERVDSLIFGIPYVAITARAAGLNSALTILHLDGNSHG
jgi:hypothetical protein